MQIKDIIINILWSKFFGNLVPIIKVGKYDMVANYYNSFNYMLKLNKIFTYRKKNSS
jgi:hypothetical protein